MPPQDFTAFAAARPTHTGTFRNLTSAEASAIVEDISDLKVYYGAQAVDYEYVSQSWQGYSQRFEQKWGGAGATSEERLHDRIKHYLALYASWTKPKGAANEDDLISSTTLQQHGHWLGILFENIIRPRRSVEETMGTKSAIKSIVEQLIRSLKLRPRVPQPPVFFGLQDTEILLQTAFTFETEPKKMIQLCAMMNVFRATAGRCSSILDPGTGTCLRWRDVELRISTLTLEDGSEVLEGWKVVVDLKHFKHHNRPGSTLQKLRLTYRPVHEEKNIVYDLGLWLVVHGFVQGVFGNRNWRQVLAQNTTILEVDAEFSDRPIFESPNGALTTMTGHRQFRKLVQKSGLISAFPNASAGLYAFRRQASSVVIKAWGEIAAAAFLHHADDGQTALEHYDRGLQDMDLQAIQLQEQPDAQSQSLESEPWVMRGNPLPDPLTFPEAARIDPLRFGALFDAWKELSRWIREGRFPEHRRHWREEEPYVSIPNVNTLDPTIILQLLNNRQTYIFYILDKQQRERFQKSELQRMNQRSHQQIRQIIQNGLKSSSTLPGIVYQRWLHLEEELNNARAEPLDALPGLPFIVDLDEPVAMDLDEDNLIDGYEHDQLDEGGRHALMDRQQASTARMKFATSLVYYQRRFRGVARQRNRLNAHLAGGNEDNVGMDLGEDEAGNVDGEAEEQAYQNLHVDENALARFDNEHFGGDLVPWANVDGAGPGDEDNHGHDMAQADGERAGGFNFGLAQMAREILAINQDNIDRAALLQAIQERDPRMILGFPGEAIREGLANAEVDAQARPAYQQLAEADVANGLAALRRANVRLQALQRELEEG